MKENFDEIMDRLERIVFILVGCSAFTALMGAAGVLFYTIYRMAAR